MAFSSMWMKSRNRAIRGRESISFGNCKGSRLTTTHCYLTTHGVFVECLLTPKGPLGTRLGRFRVLDIHE